jgi:hypothetical protein
MENNCVELVQNQLLQEEDGATSSTPVELEEKMGDLDLESNSLMHIRNIDRNVDNTNRNRIQERTMPQLQPLYDHVGMLQQLNHVYQLPKLPSSFGHVEQLTPFSSHVYQLPQLPPWMRSVRRCGYDQDPSPSATTVARPLYGSCGYDGDPSESATTGAWPLYRGCGYDESTWKRQPSRPATIADSNFFNKFVQSRRIILLHKMKISTRTRSL